MIKLLNLFYSFSCFVYSICVVSLLALLPHSAGSLGGYPCSRSLSDPYYFQPRSFLCASGHCFWITHKHLNLQNWRIFSDESLSPFSTLRDSTIINLLILTRDPSITFASSHSFANHMKSITKTSCLLSKCFMNSFPSSYPYCYHLFYFSDLSEMKIRSSHPSLEHCKFFSLLTG